MTRREIWKDFFKRTVLPAVIAFFILHVQERLYRGRADQLLLCMAVLRYSIWYSPYVRMACTAWV